MYIVYIYCVTEGVNIDGDDPKHIQWIMDKSIESANEYNIHGITYRLTQGKLTRLFEHFVKWC